MNSIRRTILVALTFLSLLCSAPRAFALYQPGTGRFHTMDSYEGRSQDPRSLHKYLYAHADPVNNGDPSGKMTVTQSVVTISVIGALVGTVTWVGLEQPWSTSVWGRPPTAAEQARIDAVRAVIRNRLVGVTLQLTTDPPLTIDDRYADFNDFVIADLPGEWARTGRWPRGSVKLSQDLLGRPPEEAAAIFVHEVYHVFFKSAGWAEEKEAWEISAHVWTVLGLPRRGAVWAAIEEENDDEVPIPSEDAYHPNGSKPP